jgi:hypothetical protein
MRYCIEELLSNGNPPPYLTELRTSEEWQAIEVQVLKDLNN